MVHICTIKLKITLHILKTAGGVTRTNNIMKVLSSQTGNLIIIIIINKKVFFILKTVGEVIRTNWVLCSKKKIPS